MKICVDIDGVLADVREYVEKYLTKKNDWDEYFKHTEEFKSIRPLTAIVGALSRNPCDEVYLVTGRPESNRDSTLLWFLYQTPALDILSPDLFMRKDGDYRHTWEIKMEWFRQLKPDLIIDDDPKVVKAATKEGFIVLQVHGFRVVGTEDGTPHFSERNKDEQA